MRTFLMKNRNHLTQAGNEKLRFEVREGHISTLSHINTCWKRGRSISATRRDVCTANPRLAIESSRGFYHAPQSV
jgi:hypothetical protein